MTKKQCGRSALAKEEAEARFRSALALVLTGVISEAVVACEAQIAYLSLC